MIPTLEYPEPDYVTAIFIAVLLVIEKLVTIYHANHFVKEFLTKDKVIRPIGAL